jgi:ferritin-like protein
MANKHDENIAEYLDNFGGKGQGFILIQFVYLIGCHGRLPEKPLDISEICLY